MKLGSLIVVGTGISLAGQCSIEARNAIAGADVVLSVMGDTLIQQWLEGLNPNTRSLQDHYARAPNRPAAYASMAEDIVQAVRAGNDVCAVFYGHPGVFVTPSHEAIRRVRAEGFEARMLPAVSAEDCLFADLGVDPGALGCQSYEARDFLVNARRFDPNAALILWQIAVLGDGTFSVFESNPRSLEALSRVLMEVYPGEHMVTVYAAATLPVSSPGLETLMLRDLCRAGVTQASTLFIPPLGLPRASAERLSLLEGCLNRP